MATKLRAVEILGEQQLNTILVATLQSGVNDHEIGAIVKFGVERRWVTGVSLQPATYSGRHVLPSELENRITFPDVIRAIATQTEGMFVESDFLPLPCAHPNCHSLSYAYRGTGTVLPLTRFINAQENLDLLANGITFTRPRARQLIERYLERLGCCGGNCGPVPLTASPASNQEAAETRLIGLAAGDATGTAPRNSSAASAGVVAVELTEAQQAANKFFAQAIAEQLEPADVFRITITSFLDAYNFDVRRLMKCCIHHVLPSGHVIPFCAYNVLYRNGTVPLPPLKAAAET